MSALLPYSDMTVEIVQETPNPAAITAVALAITMKSDANHIPTPVSETLCSKLVKADHMSVFEHVSFTFLIQKVSRSFLAQITRQRTAKPTSGSQHYQDYRDYPLMVHELMLTTQVSDICDQVITAYIEAVEEGAPVSEARQLLPNACAVNYLWTIDARNLFYFLAQRCCNRNVTEMRIFANRTLSLAKEKFPELFNHCGPQCFTDVCYQDLLGMQCEAGTWEPLA